MTVSNEDRKAMTQDRAIAHLAEFFAERRTGGDGTSEPSPADRNAAKLYFAVLVSHGWGPRPTVERKEIERHIFHAVHAYPVIALNGEGFDRLVSAAVGAVMRCGIEVTDGD